jgi:hypothetical protein
VDLHDFLAIAEKYFFADLGSRVGYSIAARILCWFCGLDAKPADNPTMRSVADRSGEADCLFGRSELRASPEQREALYQTAPSSSQLHIENVALLILAGLIAAFGLLENSASVIMGRDSDFATDEPYLSAALALLLGDTPLPTAFLTRDPHWRSYRGHLIG